jgi:hypothetical protein
MLSGMGLAWKLAGGRIQRRDPRLEDSGDAAIAVLSATGLMPGGGRSDTQSRGHRSQNASNQRRC